MIVWWEERDIKVDYDLDYLYESLLEELTTEQKQAYLTFVSPNLTIDERVNLVHAGLIPEWHIKSLALRVDITNAFFYDLVERNIKGLNWQLGIIGTPGSGKSFSGIFISFYVWQKLKEIGIKFKQPSVRDAHFEQNQFLESFEQVEGKLRGKRNVMLDEDIKETGIGSSRTALRLVAVSETMRKKLINFLYCCNHIPSYVCHFVLETMFDKDLAMENNLVKILVYVRSPTSVERLLPIGYIYVPLFLKYFPKHYSSLKEVVEKFNKDYQKKKDIFLNRGAKPEFGSMKVLVGKLMKKIDGGEWRDYLFYKKQGFLIRLISKINAEFGDLTKEQRGILVRQLEEECVKKGLLE